MRKHTLSAFILIGLMFAATTAAQAQTTRRAVFNVPFDFVIGKRTLPAGKYTIKRLVRDNDSLFLLTSADGRKVESIQTTATQAAQVKDAAQLEFRRYGDTYFLAKVWEQGTQTGHELRPSRLEQIKFSKARDAKQTEAAQTVAIGGRLD